MGLLYILLSAFSSTFHSWYKLYLYCSVSSMNSRLALVDLFFGLVSWPFHPRFMSWCISMCPSLWPSLKLYFNVTPSFASFEILYNEQNTHKFLHCANKIWTSWDSFLFRGRTEKIRHFQTYTDFQTCLSCQPDGFTSPVFERLCFEGWSFLSC